MTERLTKEREAEIREAAEMVLAEPEDTLLLLAEIDALRAERDAAEERGFEAFRARTLAEIDDLLFETLHFVEESDVGEEIRRLVATRNFANERKAKRGGALLTVRGAVESVDTPGVAALRVALAEACDGWEVAASEVSLTYPTSTVIDSPTIARLRGLLPEAGR